MAKINFRTCLSGDSKDFSSESGSKYLDQYEYDFDDKGEVKRTTLHKTDKPINVYARIQADYESCDINAIMRRFALGDSSVLDVKSGFYADVTKMPKTLAEVFARNVEAQRVFDHPPLQHLQHQKNDLQIYHYTDQSYLKIHLNHIQSRIPHRNYQTIP